MSMIIGPVLARSGGYVFDTWTPDDGIIPSFVYPRIDNAYYARAIELAHYRRQGEIGARVFDTVAEFAMEAAWEAELS